MEEKYRFTGEWPPAALLNRYPNWEYALDEEGVEGQDETTIRPEPQQEVISNDTAYTAAFARQRDGTRRTAVVVVIDDRIQGVDVFFNERDAWRLNRNGDAWEPFIQTWLPESERMLRVDMSDGSVFPLYVETLLPSERTGRVLSEEIG